MALELAGVGLGNALVAHARRLLDGFGRLAGDGFQLADNVPHRGGFAAAQVVGFADGRLEGGDGGGGAIGDLDAAPDLHAVTEDRDGAAARRLVW